MYELTGLDSLDWLLLGMAAVGIGLVVLGAVKGRGAAQIMIPVSGLALVGLSILAQPGRFVDTLVGAVTTFPAVIFFGLMLGFVGGLVWVGINRLVGIDFDGWAVAGGAFAVVVGVGAMLYVQSARDVPPIVEPPTAGPQANEPFELVWSVSLGGHPIDMTFDRDRNQLYVTLGEGEVIRLSLEDMANPGAPEVVASGLIFPRGIAVNGSQLFVAETGDLPCDTVFPACNRLNVNVEVEEVSDVSAEAEIVRQSRARVIQYQVTSSGDLSQVGNLLEDLPVANTDHAVNGLKMGPGGELYVAIGHIDSLVYSMGEFHAVEHPSKDLLGTVLRVDPVTGDYEVVAEGIRNIFGIAIDPMGVPWGVDNDGGAVTGMRREEVLRIVDGANFGFPYDGSNPPFTVRTEAPAYTRDATVVGSGGTEFIQLGGREGLVMGSLGGLYFLQLAPIHGAYRVPEAVRPELVIGSLAWPVAIERVGPNALVYAEYGANRIHLLAWSE